MRFLKKIWVFIPFFVVLLMSQNTFAAGVWIDNFGARVDHWNNYQCNQTEYNSGYLYNQIFYGCHLTGIQVTSQNVTATGNALMWSGKLNVVKKLDWQNVNDFYTQQEFNFIGAYFGGVELNIENIATNYWITTWGDWETGRYQTLTIAWTITATARQDITNQTNKLTVAIFPRNRTAFDQTININIEGPYYFENNNEAMEVFFTRNGLEGLNELVQQNQVLQIQNQTMINQNNQILNQNQQYYDANYDAVDNINNQQANYPDASNQQTTNLLGVLLNFLGIITNFSATTCELNMPIPDFLGGSQLVNICQGRDLFGTFLGVMSSMVALGFYMPLCLSLLYMIYNEIRSFTNG